MTMKIRTRIKRKDDNGQQQQPNNEKPNLWKCFSLLLLMVKSFEEFYYHYYFNHQLFGGIFSQKTLSSSSSSSSLSLLSSEAQKYDNIINNINKQQQPEDEDEKRNMMIRIERESHRPYSQYCSTKVINEQQLYPYDAKKKIISFALFRTTTTSSNDNNNNDNDNIRKYKAYEDGLKANIKGAALYYPDWIIRVVTVNLSDEDINNIINIDPSRVEIVLCGNNNNNHNNNNNNSSSTSSSTSLFDKQGIEGEFAIKALYRFLAYDDPSVDVIISRDLDSRFSPRELLAVNEWLSLYNSNNNNYCFHVMQDHKYHMQGFPILAGMFGIKKGCLLQQQQQPQQVTTTVATTTSTTKQQQQQETSVTELIDQFFNTNQVETWQFGNFDQYFLKDMIYPLVVPHNNILYHTLNTRDCTKLYQGTCKPFPLQHSPNNNNQEHFIGNAIRGSSSGGGDDLSRLGYECALECKLATLY